MQIIQIDHQQCKRSYACIRACPVKAIQLRESDDMPVVNHKRCIGCGSCLPVCSARAISHISETEEVLSLLAADTPVAAIVDPTISGEFPDITDYRKFVEMIRTLGFRYVNEVSFGVDLVARQYKKRFDQFKGKYYLTANCPTLVSYVEKYQPGLIENLAPILTPMTATAKVIRKKFGKDTPVVYIGPCLSLKHEAKQYKDDGRVDAVITFRELRELFARNQVKESKVEYADFDGPIGYLGSLYPLSNGILYAGGIGEDLLDGRVTTADGKNNMIQAVEEFGSDTERIKSHFNLFYDEGCLNGPGTTDPSHKYLRRTLVLEYARKRLRDFDRKQWEEDMAHYGQMDLSRGFSADDQRLPLPNQDQIEETLKSLGKQPGFEAACAACGFRGCHDFAISVNQGLTRPDMCLNYSLRNREEYIRTLKKNNEKLSQQQSMLLEVEKELRAENREIGQSLENLSSLLKNLPSAVVIVDEDLRVLVSNQSFVRILGEDAEAINEVIPGLAGADLKSLLPKEIAQLFGYVLKNNEDISGKDMPYGEGLLNVSVFSLKPKKTVGAVFRDMYVAEVRQEEIIHRINEAIDENLKMVQNIAFLLGEGASHTEKMLNSIVETYRKTKKP